MQWAIQYGLGRHPAAIRRQYSTPLLHLLFDAYWWANYLPPDDPKGKNGARGPVKTIDARGLSDSQFMGLIM
jgi:hypothetical protein